MIIIPAIDIKNGNCVRLLQGDPDKETVYSNDPVQMAIKFEEAKAGLIHIVDLDGAFEGKPVNLELVSKIAKSVSIPVEIGGGIRNIETVELYVQAGIERIIIGSAILDPEFDEIIKKYKDKIIAGIDAKDSMVAIKGWKDVTSIKADELIDEVMSKGVQEIIYTDISTDGMLQGPNIAAFEHILAKFPQVSLIASGGVSSIEDIVKLNNLKSGKLKGVITGKAIYDGRLNLSEAVKAVS